jgi:hypothetical protein
VVNGGKEAFPAIRENTTFLRCRQVGFLEQVLVLRFINAGDEDPVGLAGRVKPDIHKPASACTLDPRLRSPPLPMVSTLPRVPFGTPACTKSASSLMRKTCRHSFAFASCSVNSTGPPEFVSVTLLSAKLSTE